MNCYLVAHSLVERALPQFFVGIGVPLESFALQLPAAEVEYAYLLAWETLEYAGAGCRREIAVVRHHRHVEVHVLHVPYAERYVAERMVFAPAGAAEVGNAAAPLSHTEARGLGLVVVLLFVYDVQYVGIAPLEILGQGVAVAHDGIGCAAVQDMVHAGSVAAYQVAGMAEDGEGNRVRGVVAVAKDNGIEGTRCRYQWMSFCRVCHSL